MNNVRYLFYMCCSKHVFKICGHFSCVYCKRIAIFRNNTSPELVKVALFSLCFYKIHLWKKGGKVYFLTQLFIKRSRRPKSLQCIKQHFNVQTKKCFEILLDITYKMTANEVTLLCFVAVLLHLVIWCSWHLNTDYFMMI